MGENFCLKIIIHNRNGQKAMPTILNSVHGTGKCTNWSFWLPFWPFVRLEQWKPHRWLSKFRPHQTKGKISKICHENRNGYSYSVIWQCAHWLLNTKVSDTKLAQIITKLTVKLPSFMQGPYHHSHTHTTHWKSRWIPLLPGTGQYQALDSTWQIQSNFSQ